MAANELKAFAEKHGLTIEADFIPWSLSRNAPKPNSKDENERKGWLSLNWQVLIKRGAYVVAETTYSAGSGHCPASKTFSKDNKREREAAVREECESGRRVARVQLWACDAKFIHQRTAANSKPDLCDVLASLALDASVLDAASFEDWAADLGYDTDSRKAEVIYRECLKTALRLRSSLGEAALSELLEAAQDY